MTLTALRTPDQTRPVRPRLAGAHLDAMTADADTPPRALVVGSAGSGKSGTLRHLRAALSGRGVDVVVAHPGVDLAAVPAADVVLVDDAHLLDDRRLAVIAERIEDPAAGIVVACRPWPQSDALRLIARRLEASRPAIVLGHVTATDALTHDLGADIAAVCVQDILERCGNATWLVSEALALHDEAECAAAPDHAGIAEALSEVIAHRVQTLAVPLRDAIETLCLAPTGQTPSAVGADMLAAGHAEGLIQRNGQPAPVVRTAVRATATVARIAAVCASEDIDDSARADLLGDVRREYRRHRLAGMGVGRQRSDLHVGVAGGDANQIGAGISGGPENPDPDLVHAALRCLPAGPRGNSGFPAAGKRQAWVAASSLPLELQEIKRHGGVASADAGQDGMDLAAVVRLMIEDMQQCVRVGLRDARRTHDRAEDEVPAKARVVHGLDETRDATVLGFPSDPQRVQVLMDHGRQIHIGLPLPGQPVHPYPVGDQEMVQRSQHRPEGKRRGPRAGLRREVPRRRRRAAGWPSHCNARAS